MEPLSVSFPVGRLALQTPPPLLNMPPVTFVDWIFIIDNGSLEISSTHTLDD